MVVGGLTAPDMLVGLAIVALLAAAPFAATAAVYAASRGQRGDTGTEPLHAAGTAWAFVREWLATMALLAATPFRLRDRPGAAPRRGTVIVVPELRCSSAGFWYVRRRLRAAGWATVAGVQRWSGDPSAVLRAIEVCMAALPAGGEVVLVGHGVGGLVARNFAALHPDLRLRHVVTLGTAHQGTRALPYTVLRGPTSGSAFEGGADLIAIFSDFDAWLVPISDAYCPHGFNIAVRGVGHCAMLLSRQVADLIAENLCARPPRTR